MRLKTLAGVGLGCCLLAGSATAQSFLERAVKRTAEAVEAAVVRAPDSLAGEVAQEGRAASPADRTQPRERGRGRGRNRADDAPEAQGLQGLPEDERFRACEARYPMNGLSGDAFIQRSTQFSACMGPTWGDGG